MLARFRHAYFRWAQPYYDRLPPTLREEARRFDEALYSWRGAARVLALVALASVLAGALSLLRDKPFWAMFWPMQLLVFSVAFVLFVAWFGFWKMKGRIGRFVLLLAGGCLLGAFSGYLGARLFDGELTRAVILEALVRTIPVAGAAALGLGSVVALVLVLRSREDTARSRALELEAERERQARLASETQLRVLQAQIEPHFLFNTLSSAQYLAEAHDPRAAELLARLNRFLRGTLEATRRRSISLGEEIELARSYLAICQLRLGHRLTVEIDADDSALATQLPPASVLTLIENAIEHGIEPSTTGGPVEVSARAGRDIVLVEVRNGGEPLRASPAEGTGLANVRARLALLCGDGARLELFPRDGLTVASLTIPRETPDERTDPPDR